MTPPYLTLQMRICYTSYNQNRSPFTVGPQN